MIKTRQRNLISLYYDSLYMGERVIRQLSPSHDPLVPLPPPFSVIRPDKLQNWQIVGDGSLANHYVIAEVDYGVFIRDHLMRPVFVGDPGPPSQPYIPIGGHVVLDPFLPDHTYSNDEGLAVALPDVDVPEEYRIPVAVTAVSIFFCFGPFFISYRPLVTLMLFYFSGVPLDS